MTTARLRSKPQLGPAFNTSPLASPKKKVRLRGLKETAGSPSRLLRRRSHLGQRFHGLSLSRLCGRDPPKFAHSRGQDSLDILLGACRWGTVAKSATAVAARLELLERSHSARSGARAPRYPQMRVQSRRNANGTCHGSPKGWRNLFAGAAQVKQAPRAHFIRKFGPQRLLDL